jgi:phosphoserine aminotransferase
MTDRVFNFSSGPGVLPVSVLERAQRELVSLPGVGASPLEVSHRGEWFTGVIEEAEANLRELLDVPESHHVVFCQGGATMQFAIVAMNLLRGTGRSAEYVVTGSWSAKASKEAERQGQVRVAWSGSDGAAYAHVTTNETIQGVEFHSTPVVPDSVPLVADMSSDFLSRPIDVSRFGVLYAGAQKNAGPAGVTVVIVRGDLLARAPSDLPTMMNYRTYVEHGSRYNTPPVFSIYVLMLVTRWLRDDVGGLDRMLARNRAKAGLLYDVLDGSGSFYRGHARDGSRSVMNVTFRLPTDELEGTFLSEAATGGMIELKGHRSVGGIRASIYNAMPIEGVRALAAFMREFHERHG